MHAREALDAYATQLAADGRAPATVKQARLLIGAFVAWLEDGSGSTDVADLGHEDVARFLTSDAALLRRDGQPKKASSANALRTALRQWGRFLVDAGYTPTNPTRLVRLARTSPAPPRGLSKDEVRRLLAAVDAAKGSLARRDGVLIRLMLGTGLRLSSALALRVEDLDPDHGEILVRRVKGDRPTVLPISRRVARILATYTGSRTDGPVFRNSYGHSLGNRDAGRRIAAWADKAGLAGKAHAHAFRHSHAMALYRQTRDLGVVKEALGHASLSTTQVYARADQRALRAALRR